jgi:hypothetical protein
MGIAHRRLVVHRQFSHLDLKVDLKVLQKKFLFQPHKFLINILLTHGFQAPLPLKQKESLHGTF